MGAFGSPPAPSTGARTSVGVEPCVLPRMRPEMALTKLREDKWSGPYPIAPPPFIA